MQQLSATGAPVRRNLLLVLVTLLLAAIAGMATLERARADGTIGLSANSYTVDEGDPVTITVNRTGGIQNVQITFTFTNGTAVAGTDYVNPGLNSYLFTVPGSNSFSFTISTIENALNDGNRTFTVTITVPPGTTAGTTSATVTIVDDDAPPKYSFQTASSSVTEGNSGTQTVNVAVVREGSTAGTDSVTCQLGVGSTATGGGTDYTFSNQTITFNPGDTGPKNCQVTIVGDTATEANETIVLTLGSPTTNFGGGAGTNPTHTLTIIDDDGPGTLQFAQASFTVSEGAGTASVTVTRTGGSSGAASVTCSTTAGGSATAGSDYTSTSQVLNWGGGDAAPKSCTIPILQDTLVEGPETVNLQLTGASGASLGSPATATLTITDDDGTGTLQFTSATYSGTESGGAITISVTRTGGSSGAVTVNYAVAGGTATANVDYTFTPGTLSWANGETGAKSFTLTPIPDTNPEGSETVVLQLSNPTGGASLGTPNQATVTISDSPIIPVITSISPTVGACNGATVVTITGTGFTSSGTTVVFGSVSAVFTYLSSTQLVAVAPVQGPGVVDVRVTTPGGTSPNTVADDFTCTGTPVPTVTSVSPASGPVGTTVTITGTNFTGATSVTFGGVAASFTVVSSTQITATVPSGVPAGVVDVRVTNAAGTSANTAADNFTVTAGTITYTLYRTFTLIVWTGADNKPISQAIGGTAPGTTNIASQLGAIWLFNPQTQTWGGYFPGTEGVPGANDFTTFRAGTAYFIALRPTAPATVSWVAPAN